MTAFSRITPYYGALLVAGLPLLAPAAAIAQTELWVDPVGGSDRIGNGRPAFPVKTIGRALELARPNTVIHLEAGTYSTGENFPLVLPPTVSLQGSPRDRSGSITIRGGGHFNAAEVGVDLGAGGSRHVAIVATKQSSIRGLAISNPGGAGVWVLGNGTVTISDNTFLDSREAGLAIATAGVPVVRDNTFSGHSNRALTLSGSTKAEIAANTFERNGTGIWVGGVSVPALRNNRLQGNRVGIEIEGITRPVLRGNQIENSLAAGIEIKAPARPDLGSAAAPGNNIIRGSATPILGLEAATLAAAGNQIDATASSNSASLSAATATAGSPAPIAPVAVAAAAPLPAPAAQFRTPPERPSSSNNGNNGAIIIPVPPPATAPNATTVAPPPPPQPATEQLSALRSPSPARATTIIPVPAPPTPSATTAKAGHFRVLVEAASFIERERVVALVPEAFASSYQGRSVMQIGVFNSQENVAEIRQRLERFGFSVLVVPR